LSKAGRNLSSFTDAKFGSLTLVCSGLSSRRWYQLEGIRSSARIIPGGAEVALSYGPVWKVKKYNENLVKII
jgi:hypothetical protein